MNEQLKKLLSESYGLDANATDDQAVSHLSALPDEKKQEIAAALGKTVDELVAKPNAAPAATLAAKTDPATVQAQALQIARAQLAAEGERCTMLRQLGETLNVDGEVITLAIANGEDVPKARMRYLAYLQEKCKPVKDLRVGDDKNLTSLTAALPHAIMLRAGVKVEKPHDRAHQLQHLTLIDMGRHFFAALGAKNVWELSRTVMAQAMLSRRAAMQMFGGTVMLAQSTSDFDSILADTIGKSLRMAYVEAPATWQIWARRATAPDFKQISRTSLSESPNLVSRKEGGEIKYVTLGDGKETYVLVEYSGGIKLTRQAIMNDDLDTFSRIPTLQANAAKRKEDDVCYEVLTANAAMADGVTLFHANHGNLGTPGAISITTLGEARKLMRLQKGPKNAAKLNLRPKYLIVPAALESVAEQFTSNQYVAAVQGNINPFSNGNRSALTPVVEPRLDDASGTAWFTAAENTQIDTVEVCFLLDEPEPVLKQETDFDTDDQKYAVRHTVAAKAIDHRGIGKNAGV